MKHELGRVIAERALILEADQALEKVFVRLGEPQASPEGDFYCAFDIERGADKDRQAIYGVDPFQALRFPLRHMTFFIHLYNRTRVNGHLYWCQLGDDLGFPDDTN